MLCLDHTITKKMREPAFAAEWDSLEPEEQIVRAIIEGREAAPDTEPAGRCDRHPPDEYQQARKRNGKPVASHAQAFGAGMGMRLKLEFVPVQPKNRTR